LVPSPAIATIRPSAWCPRISSSFCYLRGGEPVVAGDHDGADPHPPQFIEAGAHPLLDDVLEVDDAEDVVVAAHGQRRASLAADQVQLLLQLGGRAAALLFDVANDRVASPLAELVAVDVHPAHPRLGREGDEGGGVGVQLALTDAVLTLGEDDDRAPLRRLVGQRGELRRLGQLGLLDPRHGDELSRLAIAERDRAGLVEQQHVHVAGRLDRAAG
jgi:hypothetical protein